MSGSTSTGSSGNSSSVSSSSGGGGCDFTGDCGLCSECAQNGPCVNQLSSCGSNPECAGIVNCINACSPDDAVCQQGCVDELPGGQSDFFALLDCIMVQCPSDCQ